MTNIKFVFIILIFITFLSVSCKKQQTVLPTSGVCPSIYADRPDTTFSGTCTIYQKGKSLKGIITIAMRDGITKVLMMDELGVPLIVTSDSLNRCKLLRRFPPLTDNEAFITGLAITASIRRSENDIYDNSTCQFLEDLKDSNTVVYYSNNIKEKDLTKIVHNNDFYYIHHNQNNEGELVNNENQKLAEFIFNK